MTQRVTPTNLGRVADENRGAAVRARREHLGMKVEPLAKLAGVDRGKLAKFERGEDQPSEPWISRVERALDAFEAETGHEQGEGAKDVEPEPIRLTFHDIFGVGEIIAEGPADKPDELIAAVTKLIAELRAQG
jgi:transcriptional regulator with XRE-family HTH domain